MVARVQQSVRPHFVKLVHLHNHVTRPIDVSDVLCVSRFKTTVHISDNKIEVCQRIRLKLIDCFRQTDTFQSIAHHLGA